MKSSVFAGRWTSSGQMVPPSRRNINDRCHFLSAGKPLVEECACCNILQAVLRKSCAKIETVDSSAVASEIWILPHNSCDRIA